jgi:hypothetical protein
LRFGRDHRAPRGRSAQPRDSKLEEFDDEKLQDLLDDLHKVYVCLYQITFALIGYEGRFSNYAADEFPIETYPLRVEPGVSVCT